MDNLIDLDWEPTTANEPHNNPAPKSYWILECEAMEAHLVDLRYRLERGDDVVTICQSMGELVNGLNRLVHFVRISNDPIQTNEIEMINHLKESIDCLIHQAKQKMQVMSRWKPVTVLMDDQHHTEVMTPETGQFCRHQLNVINNALPTYLKEKLFNLTETATKTFSNLTNYYWPSSNQSSCNQMI